LAGALAFDTAGFLAVSAFGLRGARGFLAGTSSTTGAGVGIGSATTTTGAGVGVSTLYGAGFSATVAGLIANNFFKKFNIDFSSEVI
jgi:hypothetical protein